MVPGNCWSGEGHLGLVRLADTPGLHSGSGTLVPDQAQGGLQRPALSREGRGGLSPAGWDQPGWSGGAASRLDLPGPGTVTVSFDAAALLREQPDAETEAIRGRRPDRAPYWHIERCRISGTRKVPVEVVANGKVVATDRIDSLRRFRDDVREVAGNFECGIGLVGYNDLVEGDVIECFTSQSVSRAS